MAIAGLGLVADYGSSSENEDVEDSLGHGESKNDPVNYFESVTADVNKKPKKEKKKVPSLANPLRNDASAKSLFEPSSSVFYNPFKKEEEAKNSVLEKHVKLTTNPKDAIEINGKKICWNYRKGRCRFGHKCKYAHDSDLISGSNHQRKCDDVDINDSQLSSLGLSSNEKKEHSGKRKLNHTKGSKSNKQLRKSVSKPDSFEMT